MDGTKGMKRLVIVLYVDYSILKISRVENRDDFPLRRLSLSGCGEDGISDDSVFHQ